MKGKGLEQDFNRIAELPEQRWNHNAHYYEQILDYLGWGMDHVLDIGCGKGRLTTELSGRCAHAIGIDLAECMIRSAREMTEDVPGLEFIHADYMQTKFPRGHFDAIISVSTLHHLDMKAFLEKAKYELVTGGKLVILDLYQTTPWSAMIHGVAALAASKYMHLKHNGRLLEKTRERRSWHMHGAKDSYLPYAEIARVADQMLPGYTLKRLFYWRYWLSWVKG